MASASHMNDITREFMAQYQNPKTVPVGSSLKFLLVRLTACLQ